MKCEFDAQESLLSCCDKIDTATKKTLLCSIGALGAVALLGVTAAVIYNSKQMKAARALKRTGRVLYLLGTAMRSVSGLEQLA